MASKRDSIENEGAIKQTLMLIKANQYTLDMPIDLSNLLFFAVLIPIIIIALLFLIGLKKKIPQKMTIRIITIELVLFSTRIFLIIFDMGQFPDLVYDPLFYFLALVMGAGFMYYYIRKIEEKKLTKFGWKITDDFWKQIGIGITTAFILLLFSLALQLLITDKTFSMNINYSWDLIHTAIFFGLGAFYEEWFFRGLLFTYDKWSERRQIVLSSVMFFAIHIGYLPVQGYFIYYILMLIFSFSLGILGKKVGILASGTCHFLYVLLAIIDSAAV